MRNSRFLLLAALLVAGACLDVARVELSIGSPTGLHQITTWPTATVILSCSATPSPTVGAQTVWLTTGTGTTESVQFRLDGVGDTRGCTWSAAGFGISYGTPDLVDVVAPNAASLTITLRSTVPGRTTVVVRVNGTPGAALDVLSASSRFSGVALGHRGAGWLWPENTLLSLRIAGQAGLPMSEVNVRLTRDTVPVIMHDSTVDRTTDGHGVVEDLPAAYVLSLHAANRFGTAFSTELVPSLEQALRTADSSGLGLILNMLWQTRVPPATQARVVLRVIRGVASTSRILIMSGDTVLLKAMRIQEPGMPLVLNPNHYESWHLTFCQRAGVGAILYWPQTLADRPTATRVWELTQKGIQVYVSTTNDPTFGDSLAAVIPIAGMLTDLPPTVFRLGSEAR